MENGSLTVVGTPIGNLGDLSPRALEVLQNADLIAAEDTRTTAMLLSHYGITGAHIVPNHKFNESTAAQSFLDAMLTGKSVALVTDAGMPCISDPGYQLVQAAADAGIPVTVVPGACAAIAAIAVSGFNALSFAFYGFLPRTPGDLRKVLRRIDAEYSPLSVFYESPNRIIDTVEQVAQTLPGYSVCVCNDLTKRFERIYRGTAASVLEQLRANPNADKGEYVLLLYREKEQTEQEQAALPETLLVERMMRQGLSVRDAIASLVQERAASKSALYDASLRLRDAFSRKEGQKG